MTTPRPKLTAGPAYENAHLVSRDLLDRLRELLDEMPKPDDRQLTWKSVNNMNRFNQQLSELIASVDEVIKQPACW